MEYRILHSMTYTLHRLSSSDIAAMRALNSLFAAAFDDHAAYQAKQPDETYLMQTLARPDVIVLTAMDEGVVLGGLVAYILPKLEQERSEIYIYDLAVGLASRRQGIARALLAEVQAIASEVGAWVVYVQADVDDPPAIALYTNAGTRENVLHFDLPPRPRD